LAWTYYTGIFDDGKPAAEKPLVTRDGGRTICKEKFLKKRKMLLDMVFYTIYG
jgi:hypothetical protein